MVILFMLFLVQFSVACACLAVNSDQQEMLAQQVRISTLFNHHQSVVARYRPLHSVHALYLPPTSHIFTFQSWSFRLYIVFNLISFEERLDSRFMQWFLSVSISFYFAYSYPLTLLLLQIVIIKCYSLKLKHDCSFFSIECITFTTFETVMIVLENVKVSIKNANLSTLL